MSYRISLLVAILLVATFGGPPAHANGVSIDVELPQCLPISGFMPVYASIRGEPGGSEVRLYFRRLNEVVEDFYYLEMEPVGIERYYAVLPKPVDEELETRRLDDPEDDDEDEYREAAWWRHKELSDHRNPNDDLDQDLIEERADAGRRQQRSWLRSWTLEQIDGWLKERENEPAEIFVAIYDAGGLQLASSPIQPLAVREDCPAALSELEEGYANNLVIGETAVWQRDEEVFHWQCDGIVTRIDTLGVKREDALCRACVVAWWGANSILPLVSTSVVTLIPPEDEPVSPSLP
jgi:hypothetical protein